MMTATNMVCLPFSRQKQRNSNDLSTKIISTLALNPPTPPFTLNNWLDPELFYLIATVVDYGVSIRPRREERCPFLPAGVPARPLAGLDFAKWVRKCDLLREVQIIPTGKTGKNPLLSTPSKVLADNVICRFKGFTGDPKAAF